MAARQNEERTGVAICPVEMNANGQQTRERSAAWFRHSDAVRAAVLWTPIVGHGQDAILVNRHGPVCQALLIEIGRVDRESVGFQKPGRERINPGCFQLSTKLGNSGEEVASAKDDSGAVPDGTDEARWVQESQESLAAPFTNRAGDSHEPL
jgi:hypothetical protein